MFDVEITRTFSAAHLLRGYNGACSNLHGHNYKVTVVVRAAELDQIGIALDFKKLKCVLDALLDAYDHKNLADLPEFSAINPTSENLARLIYRQMSQKMNDGNIKVRQVKIGESDFSAVTYFED